MNDKMKVIRAKRRQRIDGGSLGNGRGGDGETRDWLVIAERGRLFLIMVLCTLMVRVAEVEDERFTGILARAKIWFSNETNSARRELGDASRRLRKEESSGEQLVGILWATALSGTTKRYTSARRRQEQRRFCKKIKSRKEIWRQNDDDCSGRRWILF